MITGRNIRTGSSQAPAIAQANDVLADIRAIIHASDVQSKRLQRDMGVTTAQALVLRAVSDLGEVTTRTISTAVSLSQATVTTVLDRLELNGLVARYRSDRDRRVVHTKLTRKGRASVSRMPGLMDETFMKRFAKLPAKRRTEISSALSELAQLMNADANDAASTVNGR